MPASRVKSLGLLMSLTQILLIYMHGKEEEEKKKSKKSKKIGKRTKKVKSMT